jgi:nucleoside-diphosphate-sugar epimerase
MKILILGGTQMIGKNFISHLMAHNKNFNIIFSNRGETNPSLFPEIPLIKIDRNIEPSCLVLSNYDFDIIVDFSCYTVDQFKNTFKYLKYKKYIYISTMSVHEKNIINNPDLNNIYHKYCINKFYVEQFILSNNIDNCLIIRPCAIYGDDDYTDRFYKKNNEYYWKYDDSKVGVGTMFVEDFSKFLYKHIHEYPEIGAIDVCNIWWNN